MCCTRGFEVTVKGSRFQAEKAAVLNGVSFTYYREKGSGADCRTVGIVPVTDRGPLCLWFLDVPRKGVYPVGAVLKYHEVTVS